MTQPLDFAAFWTRLLLGGGAGLLTWIAATGCGVAIVDCLTPVSDRVTRLAIGAALGYSLLGTAVSVLGLFHAINRLTLEALLLLALLAYVARANLFTRKTRTDFADPIPPASNVAGANLFAPKDLADRIAYVVMAAAFITALIAAALPAVWWDPIAYHLPLAAMALAHGAFTFVPSMVQSGFPSLGEAVALPAYAVAGSAGAAMVTLGAGVILALLGGVLAARIAPGGGVTAAMLVMSSPLWLWLAPSFYVDVPFAMLALAGIVLVLPGGGATFQSPPTGERIAIAGWVCGAAAAIKYSGLGVCAIVLVAAIVLTRSQRWKVGAAFLIGAMLVAGGWYARTFISTGDPLYPFLSAHLAHQPAVAAFAGRYVEMTRDWCTAGTSAGDLARLPYRLLVTPRDFCGDPGIALRAGIVFAIASAIFIRSALPIVLITIALTVAWFFASQQWRFAVAPATTYAALVASGTSVLGSRLRSIYVMALSLLGAFSVTLNWLQMARSQAAQSIVPAEAYLAGRQTATQYLDDRLETFAAAQWLAQHAGRDGILALDDVRDYYFPPQTLWGNPFYQQAIALDWAGPASARYAPLRALNIRYLVVNANEAYVHRTPTGVDWAALSADARGGALREVFRAKDTIVYEIAER